MATTLQQARMAAARDEVASLHSLEGRELYALIEFYAADPTALDYVPHFVTAIREAGRWHEIQRAELQP